MPTRLSLATSFGILDISSFVFPLQTKTVLYNWCLANHKHMYCMGAKLATVCSFNNVSDNYIG